MQVIINHALIKLSTFKIDARKQIGIDALVHTPSILLKKPNPEFESKHSVCLDSNP